MRHVRLASALTIASCALAACGTSGAGATDGAGAPGPGDASDAGPAAARDAGAPPDASAASDAGASSGDGSAASDASDAGLAGPPPSSLPVTYTRPDDGAPLTQTELDAATDELIALLTRTRYFDVVDERAHGWPESDPAHRYFWSTWWSGVTVTKSAGLVTYTHSHDGADNNGLRTAPLLEGACYAHLMWGAPLTADLVRRLTRGLSAAALAMKRDASDAAGTMLARTHYAASFTSHDGGRTLFVDTSADRPGVDGTSQYVHLPTNPTFGDIWIKNTRSKDDMGHVMRAIVQSQACAPRLSADGQADLAETVALYASWSRQVESDGWSIATLDQSAQVTVPPINQTLAHYATIGNAECPGVLAIRLLGDGDPGSFDCGNGISAVEQLTWTQLKPSAQQILRTHHEAAVNMAFRAGRSAVGLALLQGLASRVASEVAGAAQGDAGASPSDVAGLAIYAANAGVPLTSSEVRFVHARLHLAYLSYLAPANDATYRVFDPATPDGTYPFEPGGDGLSFVDIGALLGACAAPYRNPATRPLFDCARLAAAF